MSDVSTNPMYFDMFPERVQIRAECKHGQLTRSCDLCEKDATIARLVEALEVTAGNIRSLGPAGDIGPYAVYRVWLEVVEEAIKGAKPVLGVSVAGMWLSVARFKGGMLADAVRCKRCPDYCVLLDWAREPYRDNGWFKKGKPGRWVPDRKPPFLRRSHNSGEGR